MSNSKKIVNKLNQIINDYKQLSIICNTLSNDISLVIATINKVIKYAFIKDNFITSAASLYTVMLDLENINDLDEKYQKYLQKKKTFFSNKNKNINLFPLPFDKDLRLSDIKGLRLPTEEELKQICKVKKKKN